MTPVKQRNKHDPAKGVWGDCHRAVIASLLDLPLDEVPHFGEGGPEGTEFVARETAFLKQRGLIAIPIPFGCNLENVLNYAAVQVPDTHYILGGKSRTGCNHSVIGCGNKIVHDPSVSDSGIVGPCDDGFYWLTFFGTRALTKEAAE
jgi:hypothetical protein